MLDVFELVDAEKDPIVWVIRPPGPRVDSPRMNYWEVRYHRWDDARFRCKPILATSLASAQALVPRGFKKAEWLSVGYDASEMWLR